MTTDRDEQAGAHAEARTQTWTDPHSEYADGYVSGHMAGVEWADANPQPHTIMRTELEQAWWDTCPDAVDHVLDKFVRRLGIEVES